MICDGNSIFAASGDVNVGLTHAGTASGAGFSLWVSVLARSKTCRLKPAPLSNSTQAFAKVRGGIPDVMGEFAG